MTQPTNTEPAQGDAVTVTNALGTFDGIVARVRKLFDENGKELKAFEVAVHGMVEPILATVESLTHRGADNTTEDNTTEDSTAATPTAALAPAPANPATPLGPATDPDAPTATVQPADGSAAADKPKSS